MKFSSLVTVSALVLLSGCAATGGGDHGRIREELHGVIASARDRVFPALVNISVVTVDYYGGQERKGQSIGSGTIIDAQGHILTNAHVVADGRKFRVTLADKQELPAKLVGEDKLCDLAIVQIDVSQLKNGSVLSVAELGDSDKIQTGDIVMAMGSPFGLSRSVTLGIVSNTERVFASGSDDAIDAMQEESGERSGIFTRWIQHDAAINPGNSGGPLVNVVGQVVGVNTLGGTNMGFASPANLARDIAAKLIQHGEVPRSWIGATFKQITKTNFSKGVLLTSVVSSGPAAKAGIKPGDLVTAIDGQPLTIRFPEEIPPLLKRLADVEIGKTITLTYERDGVSGTATVTTEKMLRDKGDETFLRAWGLVTHEITEKTARDRRLDSTEGVLIGGVRSGGPAALAEPAIGWGDVIKSVDGQKVRTLKELVEKYRAIMTQEKIPEFVMIEFDRQGKNQVTLIKPRPDKRDDPARELAKAWIGIATQPVARDLASKLGMEGSSGFRVTRVYPGTKASSSGIVVGDIITAINSDKLSPKGVSDAGLFQRQVRKLKSGDQAKITLLRAGKPTELTVELERTRFTADEALHAEAKDFELSVRELTFFDRDDERWDDSVQGVLVENVEHAGWAGLAGIMTGDLIQQINKQAVTSTDDFKKIMEKLAKDQPSRVEFVVLRDNRTFYNFAEPDWKPLLKDEQAK